MWTDVFTNVAALMDQYNFGTQDIYNMDETGITTVQKTNHLLAQKGSKNVSSIMSAERGTLVTDNCADNAIGNYIPPMLIFPRKTFREHFITNGPSGCIGVANGSGRMKESEFLIYLKYFVKLSHPSGEKKVCSC